MKPISLKTISKKYIVSALCLFLLYSNNALTQEKDPAVFDKFIDNMVSKHQFDRNELTQLFDKVAIKSSILKAMDRPAEGLPWYKYRKIFMTDVRINSGVKYWQDNQLALESVAQQYGVPEPIIVAIIGIETLYGKRTGNHRVIDALSTLGFAYPKRSKFFLAELEQFLLLCRTEQMHPLQPTGSYAGAMGIPQFMPSSYRAYSADQDGDGKRDIWANNGDVFASIAHYFIVHNWQVGADIVYPVNYQNNSYKQVLSKGLKPDTIIKSLTNFSLSLPEHLAPETKVKLFEYKTEKNTQLWLGLDNFYTITRYNHSKLYAMAVFQLSVAIANKYASN